MWSQIIFFAAVALVIIVLLRRAASAKQGVAAAMQSSRQFGNQVGRGVSQFLVGARGAVEGLVSKQRSRMDSRPQRVNTTANTGHQFWQEEAISEKLDLSSNFDEGEILFKAGKLEEAESYFIKAASNNPANAKIYARLGLLYLQMKNYSDAIEALKVAVKLDKYNPSRHYNLSLAYLGNKDVQKAIASVREAITLDPVTQKYRQLLEQLMNG